jgi:hypothetical protein
MSRAEIKNYGVPPIKAGPGVRLEHHTGEPMSEDSMNIPSDIVDWFREVFAAANRRLAEKFLNVPAIPETSLDTTLVEHLSGYAAPRRFPSNWVIRLDTHYIGGLRHFYDRWETADIGVLIFFQQGGRLVRRKVALLQSKRLYPATGEVAIPERYDFMIGMARLGDRDSNAPSMLASRRFTFDEGCRYGALVSSDNQHSVIVGHIAVHKIPIFYLLYNPPLSPLTIELPLIANAVQEDDPTLGARVIPVEPMFKVLDAAGPGYRPSLADTCNILVGHPNGSDSFGWRLEHFLLLGCREGRRFDNIDRDAIDALFYRRSGPIAATIAVTIEVPED